MTQYKKRPIPKQLRLQVFERDNYTCRYCGAHTDRPHCDHVYPESLGGITELPNLVTACRKCNMQKRAAVGIWPMPVDFQNRIGALNGQIVATERRYGESEQRQREMELRHGENVISTAAALERTNLHNPLLLSLAAATLSIGMILFGIEVQHVAVILAGVALACVFTILTIAFRLSVSYIDRRHAEIVQALNAHRRHCAGAVLAVPLAERSNGHREAHHVG